MKYKDKNARLPIKEIVLYSNDVVIKRKGFGKGGGGERSEITRWSNQARKRLAFIASNTDVSFDYMVTLTYPSEWSKDGRKVKANLKAFLRWMDRKQGDIGYSVLWFMEFQKRGAPHFHLLFDSRVKGLVKEDISTAWYRIVGSGDKKHLSAGTRFERMRKSGARYAIKYAQKMKQKEVPENYANCGRFYGHSKDVKPEPIARVTEGNIDKLFQGDKNAIAAIEKGWSIAYNSAGKVGENLAREFEKLHDV